VPETRANLVATPIQKTMMVLAAALVAFLSQEDFRAVA
jgi:hypothetical protein